MISGMCDGHLLQTVRADVPIKHESLECLNLHPHFLLYWSRRRLHGARQAVYCRRQGVRLGGQVACKVNQSL
jgi:hypothetical protein